MRAAAEKLAHDEKRPSFSEKIEGASERAELAVALHGRRRLTDAVPDRGTDSVPPGALGIGYRMAMDILDAIGNTSLVAPRKIGRGILVKLESENPTGSMKDRMAMAVIARAEADGRLRPGDTVVEYTGGSTGTSLAFVCAAKGYRIRIVTSDAFSQEKRNHMAALGAELIVIPSEGGLSTKAVFDEMIETARDLSRRPNTWWFDQFNNRDIAPGYHSLGEEIWNQTNGRVDVFVQSAGSSASV